VAAGAAAEFLVTASGMAEMLLSVVEAT